MRLWSVVMRLFQDEEIAVREAISGCVVSLNQSTATTGRV